MEPLREHLLLHQRRHVVLVRIELGSRKATGMLVQVHARQKIPRFHAVHDEVEREAAKNSRWMLHRVEFALGVGHGGGMKEKSAGSRYSRW